MAVLVVGYIGTGFWLFYYGLGYLYHVPLIGALLSQRILFLIFGFFFVMLVFSNLIIGYTTLFRNRETAWFLSLPVSHSSVYRWKFFEALIISSWALMFLSAPMMLAYGIVHEAPIAFYLEVGASYLRFVVIPALIGSWGMVFFVRILSRPIVRRCLIGFALIVMAALIIGVNPVDESEKVSRDESAMFERILRHTRLSANPYLPSAWLARSIISWSEGLYREGIYHFGLLASNALMGMLVGFEITGRFYYRSWTASVSSRAERSLRSAELRRQREEKSSLLERAIHFVRIIPRADAALLMKDIRIFWRDPAQWTQFMIFFGLLCMYVLNLRNVAFRFTNPMWEVIISYLNLAASALTLSTLTTRFVFPQFSLEGRRIWILGLAPLGLRRVLLQKFWTSVCMSSVVTLALMVASSLMLHLPAMKVVLFSGAIGIMSLSLSGLSAGLGAIFPNFKEENPSKIVSGFGGTLCLVASFIYVTLFISLAAIPALRQVVKVRFLLSDAVSFGLAGLLSAFVLFFPMLTAWKRVKNLEI